MVASQLGPKWLNQVQQIAAPTHAGRLSRYALLADQINALEEGLEKETDEQLKARATALRLRARQGDSLNSLCSSPEAFALVREASPSGRSSEWAAITTSSSSAERPSDPLPMPLAEMATGEGKTLVATLPAFLNALAGKGVHVVTVNDYLAQRDADWNMPHLPDLLGLTVGCIQTRPA